ncbi:MAG: EthD domain-containing protein [Pseudomonadales bacterium]|nr:EthD domain-containing protein [Pseudomonadales bacterium]MBO6563440.1 EthD domain-containing protein [Pseudomonadales bacterium]MBO6595755.1 EthD domain-containing protein [Pseudomonadales bacterium]MBO6702255.1 EthD domain-containing protein [Pseudomonadales bacterium]MBO6820687.1 EthD domain-containing protein [Pseudomonadales bacterium]
MSQWQTSMKLAVASGDISSAKSFAQETGGIVFASTSKATDHLPFAALVVGATDDLDSAMEAGDAGVFLVCERTIKNKSLSELDTSELPGSVGLFPMVAHPVHGAKASDAHWRDDHAPLALEIHVRMTHYYQLAIQHRFTGPEWNGIAICCCATEDDLRNRFYNSEEGERRIIEDIRKFADTKRSARRVIADAGRFSKAVRSG